MNQDLASLFAEQQTNQIDWNGPLFSLYELPVHADALTIRFVSARADPPQGVRLKIRGGSGEVNSTVGSDIILWQDKAPEEVTVKLSWNGKAPRSLRIWNAWRINDVTQAWLGNAGMRVSVISSQSFRLECSDGEGEPDFEDLVAEVTLR